MEVLMVASKTVICAHVALTLMVLQLMLGEPPEDQSFSEA